MSLDYKALEQRLGHTFRDRSLLREALTHTSYANEKGGHHNERLEFLGDSVLNASTTDLIFKTYPGYDEGNLSALRSNLVNTETLAEIGRTLELNASFGVGVRNSGETNRLCWRMQPRPLSERSISRRGLRSPRSSSRNG